LLSKDKPSVAAAHTSRNQKAAYKPPVVATKDFKKQAGYHPNLTSPQAVADAKRQARAGTRGRQGPVDLDLSHSMGSSTVHKDKYASEEGYSHKDSYMSANSTFQSGDQSEGGLSEGLFNDNTQDFTLNETYDDTLGDDTFSLEGDTKRSQRRNMRFHFSSLSEGTSFGEGSVVVKQQVAWGCIVLSALQFAILTTQVLLCGVAALSINPTIGPYPDAFSEWGGKNAYLLVEGQQYFRYITPVFLHVGYLHLLVNVFFQLETCAYLEREWGFFQWISIYLISGFGSCLAASAIEPNTIGVCSSGALMGLFGARISQAVLWTVFETEADYIGQGSIMFERLGSIVCSAAVLFCLTFLTYIDWAGHLGGLCTGFLVGFIVFAHAIEEKETKKTMKLFGFSGLLLGGIILWAILFHYAYYDEELADACNYFRNLYTEGYSCECQAFS
jgi:rhomboid protease GluP